jgi:hypothetical protein
LTSGIATNIENGLQAVGPPNHSKRKRKRSNKSPESQPQPQSSSSQARAMTKATNEVADTVHHEDDVDTISTVDSNGAVIDGSGSPEFSKPKTNKYRITSPAAMGSSSHRKRSSSSYCRRSSPHRKTGDYKASTERTQRRQPLAASRDPRNTTSSQDCLTVMMSSPSQNVISSGATNLFGPPPDSFVVTRYGRNKIDDFLEATDITDQLDMFEATLYMINVIKAMNTNQRYHQGRFVFPLNKFLINCHQ